MPFYADSHSSGKSNQNVHIFMHFKFLKIKQISLLKKDRYSLTPKTENTRSGKRAAFRAFRRGSLTAEAAMVLPMFFLAVLSCIFLMKVYALHMETTIRLQEQAEKLGMFAHSAEADTVIDLRERAAFQIPFLPLPALEFDCRGRVRPWVGRDPEEGETAAEDAPVLVYMTEHGEVYHTTSRCSHLSLSIRRVPGNALEHLRNAHGEVYRPCEKCVGNGGISPLVLVTDQGDCYHNSLECSGLKRGVRLVEQDSLEGIPCCSRCQELMAAAAA